MVFTVKKHSKKEFYSTFCDWCEQHSFPIINSLILPENVFVCYEAKTPIYCTWAWKTDSKLLWTGFPASNKEVSFDKKIGGLDYLIEEINEYAKEQEYLTVFTTSGTESIINSLTNNGFIIGDSSVNHYFKKL